MKEGVSEEKSPPWTLDRIKLTEVKLENRTHECWRKKSLGRRCGERWETEIRENSFLGVQELGPLAHWVGASNIHCTQHGRGGKGGKQGKFLNQHTGFRPPHGTYRKHLGRVQHQRAIKRGTCKESEEMILSKNVGAGQNIVKRVLEGGREGEEDRGKEKEHLGRRKLVQGGGEPSRD